MDKETLIGVRLTTGETLMADHVVMNADFGYAMTSLMGNNNISRENMGKKPLSCSTYMLYLGLDKIYQDQPHHQILMAEDYV